ncbi:MAG: hypothetical protein IJJ47_07710 [Methanosphaera sp.]|nr:hypothetical protein [Methanosphaera sp.]
MWLKLQQYNNYYITEEKNKDFNTIPQKKPKKHSPTFEVTQKDPYILRYAMEKRMKNTITINDII